MSGIRLLSLRAQIGTQVRSFNVAMVGSLAAVRSFNVAWDASRWGAWPAEHGNRDGANTGTV